MKNCLFLIRIVFSNYCSELVCIKPQSFWFWSKHHAIALLPANDCSDNPPLRLDFGFVGTDDTTSSSLIEDNSSDKVDDDPLTQIKFDIKIAEVKLILMSYLPFNIIHVECGVAYILNGNL